MQLFQRDSDTWPGMGEKFEPYGKYIEGPKYPVLWPRTQPREDEVLLVMHNLIQD